MNNTTKKVAAYIVVPIIYAAIGIFAIVIIFKPYIAAAGSVTKMMGAPSESFTLPGGQPPSIFDSSKLESMTITGPNTDTEPTGPEGTLPAGTPGETPSAETTDGSSGTAPQPEYVDGREIVSPDIGMQYGVFEIKSLGVKANLYFGDSAEVLKYGVGQFTGSFMPGNGRPILVAAHNNTYFHLLGDLKEGDIVTITTNYGVYEYEVSGYNLTTNKDKNAYDLSKKEEELIMYTCYPFNMLGLTSQRYFVYATKKSGPTIIYN